MQYIYIITTILFFMILCRLYIYIYRCTCRILPTIARSLNSAIACHLVPKIRIVWFPPGTLGLTAVAAAMASESATATSPPMREVKGNPVTTCP